MKAQHIIRSRILQDHNDFFLDFQGH